MNAASPEKTNLHPRNAHRFPYEFDKLMQTYPALRDFVHTNPHGNASVDFADPAAVKALNTALLMQFYGLEYWDIPRTFLCPPIPGRADYIHYLADLLALSNGGKVPEGKDVRILDIGTGANFIYPIIGHHAYGWSFAGTDSDTAAVAAARHIIAKNPALRAAVDCRLQPDDRHIFEGVLKPGEQFAASMCNPPFHASLQEADAATRRKQRNLGTRSDARNFGGRSNELWTPGGEVAFIKRMIRESTELAARIGWFTTLVSKKESLHPIYSALYQAKAADVKTIAMAQGQKASRIVAWTFGKTGA